MTQGARPLLVGGCVHTCSMPTFHFPKPGERPDVEVLVANVRCPGELRMWTPDDDGASFAQVQYRPPGSHSKVMEAFSTEDVREDYTDRSRGRP